MLTGNSNCNANEYYCPITGGCLLADGTSSAEVCDGTNDCQDMKDELGCNSNCGVNEVHCGGTECSPNVCDKNNDCGPTYKYVDEIGC